MNYCSVNTHYKIYLRNSDILFYITVLYKNIFKNVTDLSYQSWKHLLAIMTVVTEIPSDLNLKTNG